MANGICVYAESYNGELETVACRNWFSAAKGLAEQQKKKFRQSFFPTMQKNL